MCKKHILYRERNIQGQYRDICVICDYKSEWQEHVAHPDGEITLTEERKIWGEA